MPESLATSPETDIDAAVRSALAAAFPAAFAATGSDGAAIAAATLTRIESYLTDRLNALQSAYYHLPADQQLLAAEVATIRAVVRAEKKAIAAPEPDPQ